MLSNLKVRRLGADGDNGAADDGAGGDEANKIGVGEADAYIVFDLLTGTNPANLDKTMAGKSVAVVSSSKVPTSAMVRDTSAEFPEWTAFQRVIDDASSPDRNVYFDAGTLSDSLFRSHMPANVLVVGAAYQAGVIPISASAIERAIELNGVAVEMNTQAFRIGRKIVLDPDFLGSLEVGASRAGEARPRPVQARAGADRQRAGPVRGAGQAAAHPRARSGGPTRTTPTQRPTPSSWRRCARQKQQQAAKRHSARPWPATSTS